MHLIVQHKNTELNHKKKFIKLARIYWIEMQDKVLLSVQIQHFCFIQANDGEKIPSNIDCCTIFFLLILTKFINCSIIFWYLLSWSDIIKFFCTKCSK